MGNKLNGLIPIGNRTSSYDYKLEALEGIRDINDIKKMPCSEVARQFELMGKTLCSDCKQDPKCHDVSRKK